MFKNFRMFFFLFFLLFSSHFVESTINCKPTGPYSFMIEKVTLKEKKLEFNLYKSLEKQHDQIKSEPTQKPILFFITDSEIQEDIEKAFLEDLAGYGLLIFHFKSQEKDIEKEVLKFSEMIKEAQKLASSNHGNWLDKTVIGLRSGAEIATIYTARHPKTTKLISILDESDGYMLPEGKFTNYTLFIRQKEYKNNKFFENWAKAMNKQEWKTQIKQEPVFHQWIAFWYLDPNLKSCCSKKCKGYEICTFAKIINQKILSFIKEKNGQ